MTLTLIISALSCAGLVTLVLVKPSVKIKGHTISIFWLPALAGAAALLICGELTPKQTLDGLTSAGEMNPIKILTLFVSLTFLSVFLDEIGFFSFVASRMLHYAKGSLKKLFFVLYALVSVLTVFTSNDVVVLTFTPFICCFCKSEKIDPVPFLVGEFVAANTWSMLLVIGNPTNVYLAATGQIGFGAYAAKMWLPTVFAGLTALLTLWLLFRKQLSASVSPVLEEAQIADRGLLAIGLIHLFGCVVCLAVSSYVNLPMWLLSACFAGSLLVCTVVYALVRRRFGSVCKTLLRSIKRAPWELIPFVLSMFAIVLSLQTHGVTARLASALGGGKTKSVFCYGIASLLASNVINNIPMSVLFGGVLSAESVLNTAGLYATVIGSNLGAYLTPVGALAGIMWSGLLKEHDVEFPFRRFVFYGTLLAIPSLFAALAGLLVLI